MDHHPDLDVRWRSVLVRCSTHSAGGVTQAGRRAWRTGRRTGRPGSAAARQRRERHPRRPPARGRAARRVGRCAAEPAAGRRAGCERRHRLDGRHRGRRGRCHGEPGRGAHRGRRGSGRGRAVDGGRRVRLGRLAARHPAGAAGEGGARACARCRTPSLAEARRSVRGEGPDARAWRTRSPSRRPPTTRSPRTSTPSLGIDPDDLTDPWQAAGASAASFVVGALLPLLAITLAPHALRVPVTFVAVLLALVVTGVASARLGGAGVSKAVRRTVVGGALAMAVTYAVGRAVGGW
nr:VIT1/CCC1 transporter family protein [Angustibacter aerolatus]